MPGFSLTLLLLPRPSHKGSPSTNEILALLDAPADAPGWRWSSGHPPAVTSAVTAEAPSEPSSVLPVAYPKISAPDAAKFVQAIAGACKALTKAEPEITRMDSIAGDGDCGLTLKAGAEGLSRPRHCTVSPTDEIYFSIKPSLEMSRATRSMDKTSSRPC